MIDFYTYSTINGQAVSIALAELNLTYKIHVIDLAQGEQRRPEFLKINPSGRIPVIVDHEVQSDNQSLVITQTGAILIYLAEKTGRLMSPEIDKRAKTIEWLMFQLTDISTNYFNNFYLKSLVKPKQEVAANFMKQRAIEFYREFDQQLTDHPYICGHDMSIVDVAAYPVVEGLKQFLINDDLPHLSHWFATMSLKPSVAKGMMIE